MHTYMKKVQLIKAIPKKCRWAKMFGRCYSNLRCCKGAKGGRGAHNHDESQTNAHVELATGRVHLINTITNWEASLQESKEPGKIVIVNFSSSWSGPCRSIARPYCKLADKYPSITFLTVDADELAEMSSTWEVKATPTFFFLREGKLVDKHVGADKVELKTKIANIDSLPLQ